MVDGIRDALTGVGEGGGEKLLTATKTGNLKSLKAAPKNKARSRS